MNLKISSSHPFIGLIENWKGIFTERPLLFTEEGFKSTGMNSNNVMFSYCEVSKDDLIEYSFDKEEETDKIMFVISVDELYNAVKGYKGDISITYKETELTIITNKTTTLRVSEMPEDLMTPPNLGYTFNESINQKELESIIKELSRFDSLSCEYKFEDSELVFTGSNNTVKVENKINIITDTEYSEDEKVNLSSDNFLRLISKLPFEEVIVRFKTEMPIQVLGKQEGFKFMSMLAPRGED